MVCPITKEECTGVHCAWYTDIIDECSVVLIAESLSNIEDVLDAQKKVG